MYYELVVVKFRIFIVKVSAIMYSMYLAEYVGCGLFAAGGSVRRAGGITKKILCALRGTVTVSPPTITINI